MKVWRPQTAYSLKQGPAWSDLLGEIAACASPEAVEAWWGDYLTRRHRDYPEGWSLALRDLCEAQKGDLAAAHEHAALDAAFNATVSP
jgi:hypothetical protein